MTKKKWLVLIALGVAACVTTVTIVVVVGFFLLRNIGADHRLPDYTLDQTDSTHAGYRRTTVKFGGSAYVNDYDECALQLRNPEPTNAIGRAPFGDGKLCAIAGRKPRII